ncbi:zinc metalloprotease [Pilimelia terevasa]|uniref:Zinc metalloprotease n=1 Tax=Pilimelia terevasa TaxID=53372 RepID=A0A8J3FGE1_9ACTN|nr:trypsin-like serine protease [Pilimelia terevasa]GGK16479.1 zinc metalloprotease [Pilimelia terevasa]
MGSSPRRTFCAITAVVTSAALVAVSPPAGAGSVADPRTPLPAAAASAAADAALTGLRRADADRAFVRLDTYRGPSGTRYVSYASTYRGLPVVGGDFVVAVDGSGAVLDLPEALPRISLDTAARVPAARAERTARGLLTRVRRTVAAPQLVVFTYDGARRLAYKVVVEGADRDGPSIRHVVVDARDGGVLADWDQIARGTGRGFHQGEVALDTRPAGGGFEMADPRRTGLFCSAEGNGPIKGADDSWGSGGSDKESGCADGLYAAQKFWDMLRDWLGRDGFDGKGKGFPMVLNINDVNAYWNGHNTAFGVSKDKARVLTEIDIVAHEFGHAVFQFTPGGFNGVEETFQLNEANGDIFGALTEHYANNAKNRPDYDYSESSNPFGRGPERNGYDPSKAPRKMPNCWSPKLKDVEIHDGSGPASHMFYLMAEGSHPTNGNPQSPVCAGGPEKVAGLGIRDAGRVWMESLLLKTENWTYAAARAAALKAATRLFPGDCAKFATVRGAWDGIAVPARDGEPTCGAPQRRVIGGEEVTVDVPWAAGLGNCSASLVAPQWVLTAKHCVPLTTRRPELSIGHREKAKGARYKTVEVRLGGKADLTLLKLDRPVPDAQPVRLADANPAIGSEVDIYGWGATCENCPVSPVLRTARMRYDADKLDHAKGPALYLTKVTGSAWKGDSGGPAFHQGVQVGVASTANPDKDAWYASVAASREWIRSVTGV